MASNDLIASLQRELAAAKSLQDTIVTNVAAVQSHLSRADILIQQIADNEEGCPICHEPIDKPTKTPCNHVFCEHCITRWIVTAHSATCPSCRSPCVFEELRHVVQQDTQNISASTSAHSVSPGVDRSWIDRHTHSTAGLTPAQIENNRQASIDEVARRLQDMRDMDDRIRHGLTARAPAQMGSNGQAHINEARELQDLREIANRIEGVTGQNMAQSAPNHPLMDLDVTLMQHPAVRANLDQYSLIMENIRQAEIARLNSR